MTFRFQSNGARGYLAGASIPVESQIFHMATVSNSSQRSRIVKGRDKLVETLEIRKAAVPPTPGSVIEVSGAKITLPEGWRPPHVLEAATVNKQLQLAGAGDTSKCTTALRPQGTRTPTVLATCQVGVLLGIVDKYSFEGKEAELRGKVFGREGSKIPPAEMIQTSDRVGFVYKLDIAGTPLNLLMIPYDQGVAQTWIVGSTAAAETMLLANGSSFSGPHPASLIDWAAYYPKYRPIHPAMLCPVGVIGFVLLLGALMIFLMMRSKKKRYADLEDD